MGTIKNLADRFRALDFERVKQESLRAVVPDMVPELNRQQLRLGQLVDGALIKPQLENPLYAITKQSKGGIAPFLTPDLRDTGDFYAGITTIVTLTGIRTFSLDLKAPKLELKYSPLIYGLNAENLSKIAQAAQPVLHQKLKAATVG